MAEHFEPDIMLNYWSQARLLCSQQKHLSLSQDAIDLFSGKKPETTCVWLPEALVGFWAPPLVLLGPRNCASEGPCDWSPKASSPR